MRFNHDANTINEAIKYMKNRAVQLLKHGYVLDTIFQHDWGIDARFDKLDPFGESVTEYQSLYILNDYRGKGLYEDKVECTILTSNDCGIEGFLDHKGIEYVSEDLIRFGNVLGKFQEYDMISSIYGDDKARRSGVNLMNHIDEGLYIMNHMYQASGYAQRAYCLHPMFQGDIDLTNNRLNTNGINQYVMMLVMEYRSVANEYLSYRTINSIEEIRLSPLKEVNDMLIADKIQNKKDFMLYHYGTHPRSKELLEYFDNWHDRLGIDRDSWKHIPNYGTL
jgi:hypothetical protein